MRQFAIAALAAATCYPAWARGQDYYPSVPMTADGTGGLLLLRQRGLIPWHERSA